MVNVKEDLAGKTFGLLTVLKQAEDYISPSGKHYAQWLCQCNCENKTILAVSNNCLKRKNGTKSCGCLTKIASAKRFKALHKTNKYDISGDFGIGYCSNTNSEFYFDLDDYDKIKDYCWMERIDDDGYHSLCTKDKNGKIIKMTTLLGFKYYDHEDRNPLNNRKFNLRPATISDNMSNRSVFKNNKSGVTGVCWNKKLCKWTAYIRKNNKQHHLGSFSNKIDAIKARLEAEIKYFGEFAPQKNLFEEYGIK